MWKIAILLAIPLVGVAQTPVVTPSWGGGVAAGNGLEVHAGYQKRGWVLLGRTRYRWWGPTSGPGAGALNELNTRSRQLEVAVLGGYSVPLGPGQLYGGLGVGYLHGRQLGDFRYAIVNNSLLGNKSYYYSYRDYQALGLPVEVGLLSPQLYKSVRLGLAFQANFNPEKTLYCGMLTCWFGRFGTAQGTAR